MNKMQICLFNGGKNAMIYFGRLGFVISVPVSRRELSFLEKEGLTKEELEEIVKTVGKEMIK